MERLTILLDNNVFIDLHDGLKSRDLTFYKAVAFLCKNKIFMICYTNFNLVEIVQTREINQVLLLFAAISEFPNLYFYDQDSGRIIESSKEEFLQRAFYKFFEFGNLESLSALREQLQNTKEGAALFEKYAPVRAEGFSGLEAQIAKINFKVLHESLGVKKGEYNHLSTEEAERNIEEKYLAYYETVKHLPEAHGLPPNIFKREVFEQIMNGPIDDSFFSLFKLYLAEMLGYKQKSTKKVGALNSLVDNYYVSISSKFHLFVTEDKDLRHKVNSFQGSCKAVTRSWFKKFVLEMTAKYLK